MRTISAGLLAALLVASPANATHWIVDNAKSRLGFSVFWSNEPFVATFKSWHTDIEFDPDDLSGAHVLAFIDLASETSDTPDNDEGLRGPEGFSIKQFPTAKFEAMSFTHRGGSTYVANGTLSLHGISRPLALPFELTIAGNIAHATAKVQISRTDFGLGRGVWDADSPIAHAVTVTLDLTATKAPN